jgi:hypothetical protein
VRFGYFVCVGDGEILEFGLRKFSILGGDMLKAQDCGYNKIELKSVAESGLGYGHQIAS